MRTSLLVVSSHRYTAESCRYIAESCRELSARDVSDDFVCREATLKEFENISDLKIFIELENRMFLILLSALLEK